MTIKLYTNDNETITFLKSAILYYGIKGDILPQYNEDGTIKNQCIIIYGAISIDYNINENTMTIYHTITPLKIKINNINKIFTIKD